LYKKCERKMLMKSTPSFDLLTKITNVSSFEVTLGRRQYEVRKYQILRLLFLSSFAVPTLSNLSKHVPHISTQIYTQITYMHFLIYTYTHSISMVQHALAPKLTNIHFKSTHTRTDSHRLAQTRTDSHTLAHTHTLNCTYSRICTRTH